MGFADLYDLIANNVAQGNGYRVYANMDATMIREPGYPLLLAAVFALAGYRIEAARLANLVLSLGIGFVMFRLTRLITQNELAALIATLLFLFHPAILIAEARGSAEIAFTFAVVAFLYSLHQAVDRGNPWRYFCAGTVLGIAAVIRSTPLLLPGALSIYLITITSGRRERFKIFQHFAA